MKKIAKDLLAFTILSAILFGALLLYSEQSRKIDDGEIIVISESQMAERN